MRQQLKLKFSNSLTESEYESLDLRSEVSSEIGAFLSRYYLLVSDNRRRVSELTGIKFNLRTLEDFKQGIIMEFLDPDIVTIGVKCRFMVSHLRFQSLTITEYH